MRLVSYATDVSPEGAPAHRAGIVVGNQVVDAAAAGAQAGLTGRDGALGTVRGILGHGVDLARLEAAAREVDAPVGALGAVRLGPPVPDPDKILCVGLNYHAHAEETKLEAPSEPTIFTKFRNSLVGDGAPIVVPPAVQEVDYEGELAIVIGQRGRRLRAEDALGAVAGIMPLNDVSARDLQFRTSQWTAGKAVDTFAPCGPALVLLDEVEDLGDLRVSTRVNGAVVQDQRTSEMIFSIAEVVAYVSSFLTLEPGDIIATGTPEGVGFTRTPPLLLQPGDTVEVEIEGAGRLSNRVEREV